MHATCLSHLILFDLIVQVIFHGVQTMTFLIMQFSPAYYYFLFGPNIFFCTLSNYQ